MYDGDSHANASNRNLLTGPAGELAFRPAPNDLVQDCFGESFEPRWPFIGRHAQTIMGNFLPRRHELPQGEERLVHVEPDVQVLCLCHWQRSRETALTLIIVHGLEGSSESHYVLGMGSKAWRAGMNVVRMNMRNCGGTEHLGPTLYNSSMSADLGAVVSSLIREDRLQQVAMAGYSMGGNLVLKLMGEWGDQAPSQAVAAIGVSPAMDLAFSVDALHGGANRIYEWKFLWGLRRRVRRKAALYPGRYNLRHLRGLRSIREFDDKITARYCGFADAEDYYNQAASSNVIERIAIPTLILHAADDPFMCVLRATRDKLQRNPCIRFVETEHGGHCAFLADPNGYDGRWAERQAVAFLQRVERGQPIA